MQSYTDPACRRRGLGHDTPARRGGWV